MATISRIRPDKQNYSRHFSDTNVVTAIVYLSSVSNGDSVAVDLVRDDGYGIVATGIAPNLTAGQGNVRINFPLDTIVDVNYTHVNRAKSGQYHLQDTIRPLTMQSAPFSLSVIPVKRFREQILMGLPLLTGETVGPLDPLQNISGVTITSTRPDTSADVYTFSYTQSSGTLSWAGGSPIDVSAGGSFRLVDATRRFWTQVQVDDTSLPMTDESDTIAYDRQQFTDAQLLVEIQHATVQVEDYLHIYIEPTQVCTQFLGDWLKDPTHTPDSPTNLFYDVEYQPVDHRLPTVDSEWYTVFLPVNYIQQLEGLHGFMNTSEVISIDKDWWTVAKRSGLVSFVPNQGAEISWSYYSGFFAQFLMVGYAIIPNFWHWKATAGLPNLKERYLSVRQAVEYQAAINVLRQVGLSESAGISNLSLSRDGISQNIQKGAGPGGIYSSYIQNYEIWMKENLKSIRQRLIGLGEVMFV